ncbi:3-oxoacyl-ACP synthase III family protein [Bacteroidota bacterium]
MGSYIHAIEYYLPEKSLDNSDLVRDFPDWDADKIVEKVGIQSRRICSDNETALDLAFHASKKVFQEFDSDTVDFIILCTQSPDYFLPTSACILQDKLKLRKDIGALDFNLGCSGYIYGLALGKSLINSRIASTVLLVMSETYSKHMHPSDVSNRSIFGDGAAATLLLANSDERIHDFILGTDGSGMENLIVKNSGIRNQKSLKNDRDQDGCLYMNGPEIFNFTIDVVPGLVKSVLDKNNVTINQIDYCIPHQANKFMLEYLRKKMKIEPEKWHIELLNTGNTVSATIPIALKDCIDTGKVKPGDKVLLIGFGVGYSWGATIITI